MVAALPRRTCQEAAEARPLRTRMLAGDWGSVSCRVGPPPALGGAMGTSLTSISHKSQHWPCASSGRAKVDFRKEGKKKESARISSLGYPVTTASWVWLWQVLAVSTRIPFLYGMQKIDNKDPQIHKCRKMDEKGCLLPMPWRKSQKPNFPWKKKKVKYTVSILCSSFFYY